MERDTLTVRGLSCLARVTRGSRAAPRRWRARPQLTTIASSALRVQNVTFGPFQHAFLSFRIISHSPNISTGGTDRPCVPLTQTPLRLPTWAPCCEPSPRPRSEGTGFPRAFPTGVPPPALGSGRRGHTTWRRRSPRPPLGCDSFSVLSFFFFFTTLSVSRTGQGVRGLPLGLGFSR